MSDTCISCRRPKATLKCGLCATPVCKACADHLDDEAFAYGKRPPELAPASYCAQCFAEKVQPAVDLYEEILGRAKGLYVFFVTRKKPVQTLRRSKTPVTIDECPDRDEAILRLGFLAAEQGFNAMVETDVTSRKVRNGNHQKTLWRGTAIPAEVDTAKLEREWEF